MVDPNMASMPSNTSFVNRPLFERGENWSMYVLDTEEIINHVKHILRGDSKNEDGEWEGVKKLLTPSLLIKEVEAVLRFNISRHTFMSNIDAKEVDELTRSVGLDVVDIVCKPEFDLSLSMMNWIVDGVTNISFLSFKRPMNQGERDMFKTTHGTQERILVGADKKKNRILSFLTGD